MAGGKEKPHGEHRRGEAVEARKKSLKVDNSLQGGCVRKQPPGAGLGEANEWPVASRSDRGRKDILGGDEQDVGLQKDTAGGSNE